MKQVFRQTSFNTGEVSPRVYGRIDLDKYDSMLKTATNVILRPQGPVAVRNGTQYIGGVEDTANNSRLIPFQYGADDAFILEFADYKIRFYQNKARVGTYELASPYPIEEVDDITYVQYGNSMYLATPDRSPRVLTRNDTEDWTIKAIAFVPPPTYEAGHNSATTATLSATSGTAVTITAGAATFLSGDIGRQVVNIASGQVGIGTITAVSSTTVATLNITETFTSTSLGSSLWYLDLSPNGDIAITLTGGGAGVAGEQVTVTSNGSSPDLFRSANVGSYICVHEGVIKITSYTSAISVTGVVMKSLDATTATTNWTLETATWNSTRGYPRAVAIAQERLIFGGTYEQPQTLWFSEQGIFDSFGIGVDDEDSIELDISSTQANAIQWISSVKDIVVGTTGNEMALTTNGTITPTNLPTINKTSWGSDTQTPLNVDNELVFIASNNRKLRSFHYDFNKDAYQADDVFLLAEHLTTPEITLVETTFAKDPDPTIYCVRSDGTMIVGIFDREQNLLGWTVFETDGAFKRCCSIQEGNESRVYIVVEREINGSPQKYIEVFSTDDGTEETHIFSDCAKVVRPSSKTITGITNANPGVVTATSHGFSNGDTVYMMDIEGMTELNGNIYKVASVTANTFALTNSSNANINTTSYGTYTTGGTANKQSVTITGLSHLNGETVEIKAENALATSQTVSAGSLTLANKAGIVVVGMPYSRTINLMRRVVGVDGDKNLVETVRWITVALLVYNATNPSVNGENNPNRNADDDMDSASPLFSGVLRYAGNDWDEDGSLSITHSGPFPMTLLGVFGSGDGSNI